jgi:hypothetical protein
MKNIVNIGIGDNMKYTVKDILKASKALATKDKVLGNKNRVFDIDIDIDIDYVSGEYFEWFHRHYIYFKEIMPDLKEKDFCELSMKYERKYLKSYNDSNFHYWKFRITEIEG